MLRAARSAWVAVGRRAVLGSTTVAAAAFALLVTAVTFISATDEPPDRALPGPRSVTRSALELADGVVAGLGNATTFLGIVAIVVGASAIAADYQHGTLRTLLVRQPDRVTLVAGKVIAVLGVLLAAALTATIVAVAAALALAGGQGIDTEAWTVGAAAGGAVRLAAAMMGFGVIGCALGAVVRSPVAAIAIGVAWVLAVEQILQAAWGATEDVLPGLVLTAIADGSAGGGEVAVAALWALIALAVCAGLTVRRDVTV